MQVRFGDKARMFDALARATAYAMHPNHDLLNNPDFHSGLVRGFLIAAAEEPEFDSFIRNPGPVLNTPIKLKFRKKPLTTSIKEFIESPKMAGETKQNVEFRRRQVYGVHTLISSIGSLIVKPKLNASYWPFARRVVPKISSSKDRKQVFNNFAKEFRSAVNLKEQWDGFLPVKNSILVDQSA